MDRTPGMAVTATVIVPCEADARAGIAGRRRAAGSQSLW